MQKHLQTNKNDAHIRVSSFGKAEESEEVLSEISYWGVLCLSCAIGALAYGGGYLALYYASTG